MSKEKPELDPFEAVIQDRIDMYSNFLSVMRQEGQTRSNQLVDKYYTLQTKLE